MLDLNQMKERIHDSTFIKEVTVEVYHHKRWDGSYNLVAVVRSEEGLEINANPEYAIEKIRKRHWKVVDKLSSTK